MHDMDNMEPAIDVAKPLPLLQDGTLDPDGVDLSGIEGVTPEQQAFAEEVLVRSIETLPRWADYDETVAAGFKSIGDGPATGEEHVIMYEWVNDDAILDPNKPDGVAGLQVRDAARRNPEAHPRSGNVHLAGFVHA